MTTRIVTSTANDGTGTLREAINSAVSGDTIIFNLSLPATITLSGENGLTINTGITIIGPGADQLTITRSGFMSAIITTSGTFPIYISGLSITGLLPSTTTTAMGLLNSATNTTLTLDSITIKNNYANSCAGINNAATTGTCTILNSSIINNRSITITSAGIYTNSAMNITNSTISGNTGFRGGLELGSLNLCTIRNSTISGNNADNSGGGIYNFDSSGLNLNIGNTIIAKNTATLSSPDVRGNFVSVGYNIIGNTSGYTGVPQTGDIINLTPTQLTDLFSDAVPSDNGGPTPTLMLGPNSVAINAGSNALIPVGVTTDQRGYIRIIDGTVDIGSVEFGSIPICFAGDSMVLTKNVLTGEIAEIEAQNVISNLYEVFNTVENKFVPMVYNIVSGPARKYKLIKKNAFGENCPNADLKITSGHKIIYQNREIKVGKIKGLKTIKVKPELVYSICTIDGCPILVNNVQVMTWKKEEWLDKVRKENIYWRDNKI